jgi:hypothetical protein
MKKRFGNWICFRPQVREDTYSLRKLTSITGPETLPKDPTAKVERKVQKLLSKYRNTLQTDLKHKLTPYRSKPPQLYGLPKIHKPDIPQAYPFIIILN